MSLKLNLKNMKEVYGDEIYETILNNIDIIGKNIQYLNDLKFDDSIGIFERCPIVFTYFPKDFKNKIDNLINQLGSNYVDIIQNDVGLIEELL